MLCNMADCHMSQLDNTRYLQQLSCSKTAHWLTGIKSLNAKTCFAHDMHRHVLLYSFCHCNDAADSMGLQRYDLGTMDMVGASAGALAATLGANGVDMREALDLALRLSDDNGVWERGGLGGVW